MIHLQFVNHVISTTNNPKWREKKLQIFDSSPNSPPFSTNKRNNFRPPREDQIAANEMGKEMEGNSCSPCKKPPAPWTPRISRKWVYFGIFNLAKFYTGIRNACNPPFQMYLDAKYACTADAERHCTFIKRYPSLQEIYGVIRSYPERDSQKNVKMSWERFPSHSKLLSKACWRVKTWTSNINWNWFLWLK